MTKTLSIITVSKNTRKDLIKTIKSIKKQSFSDYELIVVDGLSSDGSENYLKKEKRINKLIIEKDRNIYDAMNKGIKIATGKWMHFLNSGDIYFNKNTLKNIFQKSNNTNKNQILIGNYFINNRNHFIKKKGGLLNSMSNSMNFTHQSAFVRSNLQKKNLFNLKYSIAADFDFFYKMFFKKKNFYLIDKTICIVKHGGLSDTQRLKCISQVYKIITIRNNSTLIKLSIINRFIYSFFSLSVKAILPKKIINYIYEIKFKLLDDNIRN